MPFAWYRDCLSVSYRKGKGDFVFKVVDKAAAYVTIGREQAT